MSSLNEEIIKLAKYLLMLPNDYINSQLSLNSHPECFAGSAAGLGCL